MLPDRKYLEDLIAEGDTAKAIEELIEASDGSNRRQHFIELHAQFTTLKDHHRLGIITLDEFMRGRSKINKSLLEFISDSEKKLNFNPAEVNISDPFTDPDPFSFHKKMLPIIASKMRKEQSFYRQCMLLLLVSSLVVFLAGLYFQNSFFNIGGGALSSFSALPVWFKFKVGQQLLFLEGLSQTLRISPPSGGEAEAVSSTLMSLVQKNLKL